MPRTSAIKKGRKCCCSFSGKLNLTKFKEPFIQTVISTILLQIKLDVSSVFSNTCLSQHYERKITIQKEVIFSQVSSVLQSNRQDTILALSCAGSFQLHDQLKDVSNSLQSPQHYSLPECYFLCSSPFPPKLQVYIRQDFKRRVLL